LGGEVGCDFTFMTYGGANRSKNKCFLTDLRRYTS
jgi:hypothetical protein